MNSNRSYLCLRSYVSPHSSQSSYEFAILCSGQLKGTMQRGVSLCGVL
jgi:hypothetical protein